MRTFISLLPLVSSVYVVAEARRIPFIARPVSPTSSTGLSRRVFGLSPLNDETDTGYFTNITIGGEIVEVQIDTGR
jgi:hypothetical protein